MPTDPRLVDLLDALAAARRDLAGALEGVPPALRDRTPTDDAWSVAQILEHLVLVESRSMGAWEQAVGHVPSRDATDVVADDAHHYDVAPLLDRTQRVTAPEMVQPTGATTAAESWARLGATRERTEALVRAADGRALERAALRHPRFGALNGYQWLAVIAAHERRHAAQLREAAGALVAAEG